MQGDITWGADTPRWRPPSGQRLIGQLVDHAEWYRRLHIGRGRTPWATGGRREIRDAWEVGDPDRGVALLDQPSGTDRVRGGRAARAE